MSPAAQRRVLLAAVCGLASCLMLAVLTLPGQQRRGSGAGSTSHGPPGLLPFSRLTDCSEQQQQDWTAAELQPLAARLLLQPFPPDSGSSGSSNSPPRSAHLHLERLGYDMESQLRQQVFCEEAFPLMELEAAAAAEGGGGGGGFAAGGGVAARQLRPGVTMYVYAGDDEVSRTIRDGAGWENELLAEVLWALRQPLPPHALVRQQQQQQQQGRRSAAATAAAASGNAHGMHSPDGADAGGDLPGAKAAAAAAVAAAAAAAAAASDGAASLFVTAAAVPTPLTGASTSGGGGTPAASAPAPPTRPTPPPQPPLFVDVGANVGWFSVNVAAEGFQVAAFEGMASNVALVRASVCASSGGSSPSSGSRSAGGSGSSGNGTLAEAAGRVGGGGGGLGGRLRLYSFGLGARDTSCFLFSDINNRGDGITMCDAADEAAALAKVPRGYALRGRLPIRRMDEVLLQRQRWRQELLQEQLLQEASGPAPLPTEVKVLKVDVEGYEPQVFAGLGELRVWYIATEFNPVLLSGVNSGYRPLQLLEDLLTRRYRLSTTSFRGPWLSPDDAKRLAADTKTPLSIYAAHWDLFPPTAEAARAPQAALPPLASAPKLR
ncbi:hypothetical protein HYH02_001188 [Chlamydomonas schloesseri]|uniref:Methyltransferase FkbM domain-containing protein n=1 Tax=Chlamydomonas schloesseri TaxID=2026947 RepID=A0A835WUD7_9CHLO|nr:hypothetical protein HYH02_001188 [Chlamydomonas schloesseri]|eukprot:KAG2454152.1 hypothetical protein HYH02_001188 [Chlamydomonas schloesseri]